MMKKIIITGGSGSIGRKLTQYMVENGYEVVILSRTPERVTGLPKGARAAKWDGKTGEGWYQEAEGAAAIINLAGENLAGPGFLPSRWTQSRRQRILQSRLDAGQAVVDAVRKTRVKPGVVVQSSAVGYYGPQGDQMITESTPAADDFLAQVCVAWENSSADVAKIGVRHAVIRTGIFLTPDDGALKRLLLPYKLFAGGPFGNGKQFYAWVHPDDHVSAVRFLIEHESASGAFNLTSPNPLRNKDFGKTLGKVLGRPSFMPVPSFAMKLAFGEVATVVLDGQRVVPERLQSLGFSFQFPELEAALRNLLK